GLFAGIGGSLMAINFEIATDEVLSLHESGVVLLFTFIGGTSSFFGPVLGAIIGVLMTKLLPDYTAGWQMYLGIVFILVVVYAPGGLISLLRPGMEALRKTVLHKRYALLLRLLLSVTAVAVSSILL